MFFIFVTQRKWPVCHAACMVRGKGLISISVDACGVSFNYQRVDPPRGSCITMAEMFILIGSQQYSLDLIRSWSCQQQHSIVSTCIQFYEQGIPCPDNILVLPTTTLCCIYLHSVTYTRLKHKKCQNMPQIFPF